MAEQALDFKGLHCPMPIVKLSQVAKQLPSGAVLRVEATDGAFRADLEAWARRMGFTIQQFSDGCVKTAVIRKN